MAKEPFNFNKKSATEGDFRETKLPAFPSQGGETTGQERQRLDEILRKTGRFPPEAYGEPTPTATPSMPRDVGPQGLPSRGPTDRRPVADGPTVSGGQEEVAQPSPLQAPTSPKGPRGAGRTPFFDVYTDKVAARVVQEDLAELGYTSANGRPLIADGSFGRRSTEALMKFQRASGLPEEDVTGEWNRNTSILLEQAVKSLAARKDKLDDRGRPVQSMRPARRDESEVKKAMDAEERQAEQRQANKDFDQIPEGRRARGEFLKANMNNNDMAAIVSETMKGGYTQDTQELPPSIYRNEHGRVTSGSDKSDLTKIETTSTGGTIYDLSEWTEQVGGGIPKWSHKSTYEPSAIILHETGFNYNEGGEAKHFANSFKGKSSPTAHYFVDKNGKVFRFMPENRVGEHAIGWNSRAIGIEVEGIGSGKQEHKPNAKQLEATHKLVQHLKAKYGMSDDNILAHEETETRRGQKGRRTDGTVYRDDVLAALKGSGAVDWTGAPVSK
jgi:peptidoglycan hydrolase-like protein with peptidoglycan-binding domain